MAAAGITERLKVANAKGLDVSLLKATSARFHAAPKEKHVQALAAACAADAGAAAHVAAGLLARLHAAADWLTALKALLTVHRLLREGGEGFAPALVAAGEAAGGRGRGARVLAADNFLDAAAGGGAAGAARFDLSEFVRAYGRFLDETLAAAVAAGWRYELEPAGAPTRLRAAPTAELLRALPALQRALRRLADCAPRGAAAGDAVVGTALAAAVRESLRLHRAVSEGVINLADRFFEMGHADAAAGLECYREAVAGARALSAFYAAVGRTGAGAGDLPAVTPPPEDFIEAMAAYVAEAPRPLAAAGGGGGAPLRRGRGAAPRPGGATAASSGEGGAAPRPRDPGMLLPLGAAAASASPAGSAASAAAPAAGDDVATSPPDALPPIVALDLLAFEDDVAAPAAAAEPAVADAEEDAGAAAAEARAEDAAPAAPAPPPSVMDLMASLDVGAAPPPPAAPPAAPRGFVPAPALPGFVAPFPAPAVPPPTRRAPQSQPAPPGGWPAFAAPAAARPASSNPFAAAVAPAAAPPPPLALAALSPGGHYSGAGGPSPPAAAALAAAGATDPFSGLSPTQWA
jgi:hypothetical protein